MDFRHKNTVNFFDYWLSLPKDDKVPLRSSFHPEDVPALLGNIMIYELFSSAKIKRRLLGSKLDYLEKPVGTGGGDISEDTQTFWTVATQPCGMLILAQQSLNSGMNVIVETLCLPLLGDNENNAQLIIQKNILDDTKFQPDVAILSVDHSSVLQRDYIDIGAGIPELQI
ncbi:MAG: PAS domain-containing protein [Halopseudomonas aestusnigri]